MATKRAHRSGIVHHWEGESREENKQTKSRAVPGYMNKPFTLESPGT